MKWKAWVGVGAAIATGLGLFAWATLRSTAKDARNQVRVGTVLPLTGAAASLGKWIQNGYELAVNELNEEQLVPGVRIDLIYEDGMSDPRNSVSAFTKLSAANDIQILTTTLSPVTLALLPLAKERRIAVFAAAAHPGITGSYDLAFRHNLTVQAEADLLYSYMVDEIKPKKPRLVYLNDDYGIAFRNRWETHLSGASQGLPSVSFDRSTQDLRTFAVKSLADSPDCVILVGYGQQLGTLLRRLRENGHGGSVLVNNALPYPDVRAAAGEAASGVFYIDYDIDRQNSAYVQLNERYRARFGEDIPPISLFEHNTLVLIARAFKETNGDIGKFAVWLQSQGSLTLAGEVATVTPQGDIVPRLRVSRLP
ncbi:MAG TPA: ABC transporter substrate-binding protein [Phycisphaerae bacterium]|nr:ABC transporter substrate-binding protein [Phycisphaerae bacterium]